MNYSSIFQGISKGDQRRILYLILEHQKKNGVKKVNIPFAGLFILVNVAAVAGFV